MLCDRDANLGLRGSRNGNNIFALGEYPSQCNLTRSGAMSLSNTLETLNEFKDVREILFTVSEVAMNLM